MSDSASHQMTGKQLLEFFQPEHSPEVFDDKLKEKLELKNLLAKHWRQTLFTSSLKQEKIKPINPVSRSWYIAWVFTSTWEGRTVMCGCEWYQPITLVVVPVDTVIRSARAVAAAKSSGSLSTRSFRRSDLFWGDAPQINAVSFPFFECWINPIHHNH